MSPKSVFGSTIALILLGLYVYLVYKAASIVGCAPQPGCRAEFNGDMASAMALIGGLVSALVIAELAVTEPGKAPVARTLEPNPSQRAKLLLRIVTVGYLSVWIACGLTALVIGLHHPNDVEPLTTLGKSWFGLAIASGYAYFGLKP